jgi:hypothetical protein
VASFFCDIFNLHNSSHHSFVLDVACVWITSLADSIIASLIWVHSPSISYWASFRISLLWRHVLYCF